MKGKSIYLSYKELELLRSLFDYGNLSFEGAENEEEKWELAESIREKINKQTSD